VKYTGTADQGKWITDRVPIRASKKLYCKAEKHAKSVVHRMSVEANKTRCSEQDVASQVTIASNAQSDETRVTF
jgi:hypothetical protein